MKPSDAAAGRQPRSRPRPRSRGACLLPLLLLGLPGLAATDADASESNPLQKTVELLNDLITSVKSDGDKQEGAYKKYLKWCDESSGAKQNEVKVLLKEKARLEANIELADTSMKAAVAKIDELSAGASKAERKLQEFALDRKEEASNFKSAEQTLMESVKTIERAASVLGKEMKAGVSASLLQATLDTPGLEGALMALSAVVSAAGGPEGEHVQHLAALLESRQGQEGEDEGQARLNESGAAGNILDVMQDLKDDCEEELKKIRGREADAQHNYELLKQATKFQASDLAKEMEEEKYDKAAAVEKKSEGQGDLRVVLDTLKKTQESLKNVQDTCIRTASDHEASQQGRVEELKSLAQAKKTLKETMSSSKGLSFLQTARGGGGGGGGGSGVRFLQGGSSSSAAAAARVAAKRKLTRKAVALVGHLAVEQGSTELAQLAERLKAEVHEQKDPFAKVRGLIEGMLKKLKEQLSQETREKEYCDGELAKTHSKNEELANDAEDLKGKIAEGSSASAILKAQVKDLQRELSELSKQQIDMDAARQSSHETYVSAKEDIQQGLAGVRKAIDTLREYYAADDNAADDALLQTDDASGEGLDQPAAPQNFRKSSSAGNSIIGLLEVCMSDLARTLSKQEAEELGKEDEYQKLTQENKELTAVKENNIGYKTREFKKLESNIADFGNDYDTKSEELGAVEAYLAKVKERCIVAPEGYEERKKRRDANIAGLREALDVLSGLGSESGSGGSQRGGFLQQRRPRQPPSEQLAVV